MKESIQLKKKISEYRTEYKKTEEMVAKITEDTFGGTVEFATEDEDKKLHVDFWWNSPKKGRLGVDVKGIRKNDDGEYDDTFAWLEFQNNWGFPGWIYGHEDYIAFTTFTKVVYVKREILQKYAEGKLGNRTNYSMNKPKEYFKLYKRAKWGRDDLTMKVPMDDIIELARNNRGCFIAEY